MKRLLLVFSLLVHVAMAAETKSSGIPVLPNKSSSALAGQRFELVVYGGTPGGIATAVRAAREGLKVLMVSPVVHYGGALSSGLSTMDTLYNGARTPMYDELRQGIHDYYRTKYGADSEQYRRSLPNQPKTKFEAHVTEEILTRMLARETNISTIHSFYPISAERAGVQLRSVTFKARKGEATFAVKAEVFADCSYEGDLVAIAKVPYRFGREARTEFNEEHAGRIFMQQMPWPPKGVDPKIIADYRRLNLVHYDRWYNIIRPESTGEADKSVQAYNMRTIVTNDPANRLPAEKPEGYDAADLKRRLAYDINWGGRPPNVGQPNRKTYMNLPELVGVQHAYVEGDWTTRERIIAEHDRVTRGLIYFMQNDESVPEATRQGWREWGLPRDEFADNHHMPYEIYVREARRIEGRAVFTENDARPAPRSKRAPVYADAISITEWFLDSHACTPAKVGDSLWEGELLLNNITVPGQISFRTLLPQGLDNLLVPVCASSSHIGWGAIRLEPTWMSMGEAAAYATVLAIRQKKAPANIDPDELMRILADRGTMLSFFNDVEVNPTEPWYAAVQYLGTKGFFGSYDAEPLAPLTVPVAEAWVKAAAEMLAGTKVDVTERSRQMLAAEQSGGDPLLVEAFRKMLLKSLAAQMPGLTETTLAQKLPLAGDIRISRASAARFIYTLLQKP